MSRSQTANGDGVEPLTSRDVEAIHATGEYRRWIDAGLEDVSQGAEPVPDYVERAAARLPDEYSTRYKPETRAEAHALEVACERILRGHYVEQASTLDALMRVLREARDVRDGLAAAAGDEPRPKYSDGVDRGDGVETDGGRDGRIPDDERVDPDHRASVARAVAETDCVDPGEVRMVADGLGVRPTIEMDLRPGTAAEYHLWRALAGEGYVTSGQSVHRHDETIQAYLLDAGRWF